MDLRKVIVPSENIAIYELLYHIEVGLREFIIEVLEAKVGPRWWKQRLPSDVKDHYVEGREYEKNIKWCQLIPHHPMYYTDFPDLKKVIARRDNWREVFQSVFKREDIIVSTLGELEPIRNKIAHNRKATSDDLNIVEAAYQKIVAAIGERHFLELVAKCTLAEDIPKHLLELQKEAKVAFEICRACKPLEGLQGWERVRRMWWFDTGYLGHEVSGIKSYFKTLFTYSQLPRYRGSGHKIEAWMNSQNIEDKYVKAMQEFSEILQV